MFSNRPRDARTDRITVIRDVVEIVAILAAGVWAAYVFVYENSFKPSHAPPSINVTASVDRLSEHNGLVAIRIRTQVRNSSTVSIHLLGYALTAYGQRVLASPQKRAPLASGNEEELRAFYKTSQKVPVYSWAHLSKLVDPSSTYDTELDPGDTSSEEDITYLPARAFDLVTIRVNVLYVKEGTRGAIVRMKTTPQRGPDFLYDQKDSRINQFVVDPLDSLDLN